MRLKLFLLVIAMLLSIGSMAQTTITYTYDSAGNRTGRAVATQLIAPGEENWHESVGSFSAICVKSLTESIELAFTGSRQCESGEQKRPQTLTDSTENLPGEQNGLELPAGKRIVIEFAVVPHK